MVIEVGSDGSRTTGSGAITSVLTAAEHELLAQAHAATTGNITQMAQLLGCSRPALREQPKLHGFRRDTSADQPGSGD